MQGPEDPSNKWQSISQNAHEDVTSIFGIGRNPWNLEGSQRPIHTCKRTRSQDCGNLQKVVPRVGEQGRAAFGSGTRCQCIQRVCGSRDASACMVNRSASLSYSLVRGSMPLSLMYTVFVDMARLWQDDRIMRRVGVAATIVCCCQCWGLTWLLVVEDYVGQWHVPDGGHPCHCNHRAPCDVLKRIGLKKVCNVVITTLTTVVNNNNVR